MLDLITLPDMMEVTPFYVFDGGIGTDYVLVKSSSYHGAEITSTI